MRILCVTPWENTWIPYWTKFFEEHGHVVEWMVSEVVDGEAVKTVEGRYDAVLCHWADKWAAALSQSLTIPLYVIIRSYEIFSPGGWADLATIRWEACFAIVYVKCRAFVSVSTACAECHSDYY